MSVLNTVEICKCQVCYKNRVEEKKIVFWFANLNVSMAAPVPIGRSRTNSKSTVPCKGQTAFPRTSLVIVTGFPKR